MRKSALSCWGFYSSYFSLHKGAVDQGRSCQFLGRRVIVFYNLVELQTTTLPSNPKIPNIARQIPACLALIYLLQKWILRTGSGLEE